MGLSDEIAKARAEKESAEQQAALARRNERINDLTEQLFRKTGGHFTITYRGQESLARLKHTRATFGGSSQVVQHTDCHTFSVDDMIVAATYGTSSVAEWHLVLPSTHGNYLGATVYLYLDKANDRSNVVDEFARATRLSEKHPVDVLQAKNEVCPTCHRGW